jgi:hypothetical protein
VIVDWLNDALTFRAENQNERHSLAAVLQGTAEHKQREQTQTVTESPEDSRVLLTS